MARQPMVTRTIKSTKVVALCINIETAEPFNDVILLPRTYKNEKHILDSAKKARDTEEEKVVSICEAEVITGLYGMTEQEFLKHADKLPERETNKEEPADASK